MAFEFDTIKSNDTYLVSDELLFISALKNYLRMSNNLLASDIEYDFNNKTLDLSNVTLMTSYRHWNNFYTYILEHLSAAQTYIKKCIFPDANINACIWPIYSADDILKTIKNVYTFLDKIPWYTKEVYLIYLKYDSSISTEIANEIVSFLIHKHNKDFDRVIQRIELQNHIKQEILSKTTIPSAAECLSTFFNM